MSDRPPIERTTKFATTVRTLDESFAFIMSHLDQVDDLIGIQIIPKWSSSDDFQGKKFTVVVEGMTDLPPYEPGSLL